jgi:hypothetical protein
VSESVALAPIPEGLNRPQRSPTRPSGRSLRRAGKRALASMSVRRDLEPAAGGRSGGPSALPLPTVMLVSVDDVRAVTPREEVVQLRSKRMTVQA